MIVNDWEYQIKWKGYDELSWEQREMFNEVKIIEDYWSKLKNPKEKNITPGVLGGVSGAGIIDNVLEIIFRIYFGCLSVSELWESLLLGCYF